MSANGQDLSSDFAIVPGLPISTTSRPSVNSRAFTSQLIATTSTAEKAQRLKALGGLLVQHQWTSSGCTEPLRSSYVRVPAGG
jgi:hypothetical protein